MPISGRGLTGVDFDHVVSTQRNVRSLHLEFHLKTLNVVRSWTEFQKTISDFILAANQ